MSAQTPDGMTEDERGLEELVALLETGEPEAIKARIAALHPADVAEVLNTVGRPELRRAAFTLLDTTTAATV